MGSGGAASEQSDWPGTLLDWIVAVIPDDAIGGRARALGAALEPVVGQVYFAPECHRAYEALGFSGSPAEVGGVAMPDGPAYFCSRAPCSDRCPAR